jgi:hypothetical protein
MSAQAVSHDVDSMSPSHATAQPVSPKSYTEIRPIKVSHQKDFLFMLPVLVATTLAATIAVFNLPANTMIALFCGEIALFVFSVVITFPRPRKHKN